MTTPRIATGVWAAIGWIVAWLAGLFGTLPVAVAVGYDWGSISMGLLDNTVLWAALLLGFLWVRRSTRDYLTLVGLFIAGNGVILALLSAGMRRPLNQTLLAMVAELADAGALLGELPPAAGLDSRTDLIAIAAISVVIGLVVSAIGRIRLANTTKV